MNSKKDSAFYAASKTALGVGIIAGMKGIAGHDGIVEDMVERVTAAAAMNAASQSVESVLGLILLGIEQAVGSKKLRDAIETKNGKSVVALMFKYALETPDKAAMPVIAALGAEYLARGTSVDKFIRSAMRMLVVCDAEDINTLARIFTVSAASATGAYVKMLRYAEKRSSLAIYACAEGGSTMPHGSPVPLDDLDVDRAFYLVGGNGIGRTTTFTVSTKPRVAVSPDGLIIPSSYVTRLSKIINARA